MPLGKKPSQSGRRPGGALTMNTAGKMPAHFSGAALPTGIGSAAMTMTEDAKIEKYTAGSPAVHT